MKRITACLLTALMLLSLVSCGVTQGEDEPDGTKIRLSDDSISVNGASISEDTDAAVYAAHDIVFYLQGQGIAYGEGDSDDAHTREEADAHTVVHITQPGTYI